MPQRGQLIGYVRVSSTEQSPARQLDAIGEVDRLFSEELSRATRLNRKALEERIQYVREGDVVRVASMDRIARSMRDMLAIVDELLARGASLQFLEEGQTYAPGSHDAMSSLMLNMLGSFAEFERALIRERQAEGIRLAKAAGKYRGRAPKLSEQQRDEIRAMLSAGVPKAEVARRFQIDRSTLYRPLADSGAQEASSPSARSTGCTPYQSGARKSVA